MNSSRLNLITKLFGLTICLVLVGCSGGGGGQSSTTTAGGGTEVHSVRTTEIIISLEGLLAPRAIAQSKSMIRKTLLPNLGAIKLEITAPNLEPLVLNFGPDSKTAKVQLNIGHRYVIRVTAIDTSGEVISQGSADLDLLAEPTPGNPPKVSVKMEPANPSNIQTTLFPNGGNVLPGQLIYAALNQAGKIYYKINDGNFESHEFDSSTVGQSTSTENGIPIQLGGNPGDIVNLKYLAEDLDGKSSTLQSVDFAITNPASFVAMDLAVVKNSIMTSPDFELLQTNPLTR